MNTLKLIPRIIIILPLIFMANCNQAQNNNHEIKNQKVMKEKTQQNIQNVLNNNKINMHSPFYEIEVSTRGCAIDLFVNDILVFTNYETGSMAVDWPINQWILSKEGKQAVKAIVYPFDGQEFISTKAEVDLKVFVKDVSLETMKRHVVLSFPHITFTNDIQLPVFKTETLYFQAEVPYHFEGWTNSVSLEKEDKNKLLKELDEWYNEFYDIFTKQDRSKYIQLTEQRLKEINTSFYLSDEEIEELDYFKNLPRNLKKVPLDDYELVFYADGKLVGLRIPHELSGFKFQLDFKEPEQKGNFIEMALFHRKKTDAKLSIIR
ncbi:hypothetical protein [Apibacter mensalis]|uniref:hypothetical protein n=1 Tax=Apibacter mensalis TaxID=1586267 RepID=UPI0026F07C3E|nr:hypothetical protein [Apibacter mensalis]